jgi:hypothetical protein
MSFGVTLTGFVRKHLTDVVEDLQAAIKAAFGNDKRVDAKSPIGVLVGVFAQPLAEVWEVAEALYSAFDPSSAEKAQLDNCLDLVGLVRKPQVYSTATENLGGVPGTVIPLGSLVAPVAGGTSFATIAEITLNSQVALTGIVSLIAAASAGRSYVVYVQGRSFTHLATDGQTAGDVLDAIRALIAAAALYVGSNPIIPVAGATELVVVCLSPFMLSVGAYLQIDYVTNQTTVRAVTPGAVAAYAGTLTEIVTPVAGWVDALSVGDASLGGVVESDAAARQRRAFSLAKPGKTTPDALAAALLNLAGVINCTVLQNLTDVDVGSLTPHSIMAVVLGGLDSSIAAIMWTVAGCCTQCGSSHATVKDSQGQDQVVYWQRPSDINMWVRLTYSLDAESTFPVTGEALMIAAALAIGYAHAPGKDVLPERFHGPVFAVGGIKTLLVEVALDSGGAPGAYQSTPYTIADTEIARFDLSRISTVLT